MSRTLVGLALGIAFVAAVVWAALDQNRVRCEVCMSFKGRQACAESAAIDEAQARAQATNAACIQISGGVTEGIRCNATPPVSSECGP